MSVSLVYTSASSPVYPLPPPTTLLGALAFPYLRIKGEIAVDTCSQDLRALVDNVPYASAGSRAFITHRFLERIYQLPYLRVQHRKDEKMWWDVAQRGGTVFQDDELYVLYVARDENMLRYAWGIARVGRKESHVIVRNVHIKKISETIVPEAISVYTIMYAPKNLLTACENAIEVELPTISYENMCRGSRDLRVLTERFYLPLDGGMKCNVAKDRGVVVEIEGVRAVIPREYAVAHA
ncbi:MAG: type I-A CRISPR-associated protein Cas5a [Acidilobaceae archaeon]